MKKLSGYVSRTDYEFSQSLIPDNEGRFRISFLGNILNPGEIAGLLRSSGHPVKNDTPGELVYRSFLNWGEDLATRLKGSFIIVIYDTHQGTLLIARDHFGRIPLYYSQEGKGICFSTDLKTLTEKYPVSISINPEAINYYFALRYIPHDLSVFQNILKLPAASLLAFNASGGDAEVKRYWHLPVNDPPYGNEEELAIRLEDILKNAVKSFLAENNSTGAFLSGGIDSGLIVAMMSEFSSGPVKTFTIGFEEQKYDERHYAKIVSDYFDTDHNVLKIGPSDTEHFEKMGDFLDEPIGDPSVIPTYYSYRMAFESCESVLCGEGADGLLLGLRTHRYTEYYSRLYRRLHFLLHSLAPLGGRLPDTVKWKILFEGLSPEQFFLRRSLLTTENERSKILSEDMVEYLGDKLYNPEEYAAGILSEYSGSLKGKMSYYNTSTVVDNALAMRVRLANHFSLNYEIPFLDPGFAGFVLERVHPDMRIRSGTTKYLLKKVARKYLPPDLPIERKRGFNPPFSKWFMKEWWNYARERILDPDDNIINREYAEKILKRHRNNVADEGRRIFTLLMLRVWQSNYKVGVFFIWYFDEIEALL